MRPADGTLAPIQKVGPFTRPVGAVLIPIPHIITIPMSMDSTIGLITRGLGTGAAPIGVSGHVGNHSKPAPWVAGCASVAGDQSASASLLSDGLCPDRASLTN